jgi:XapX domain-containing protein
MLGSLISLLMGLAVGIVYGLVQVRSPAPPLVALVGLLGMVMGEQAVDVARRHFAPPTQVSSPMREGSGDGAVQLSRGD